MYISLNQSNLFAYFIMVIIMINYFLGLSSVWQAFLAAIFTWGVTMLGAAMVFCFRDIKRSIMDLLLGFSGGVMIAASFWSLLSPAIDIANNLGMISWIVVAVGFLSGGLLIFLGDKIYDAISRRCNLLEENINKRSLMLVFSITLHNIPEGLVVGVAFGSIAYGLDGASLVSALTLALGIGLQNFPEGSAVSLPLRREGFSSFKAFFLGQLSGIVEPIAAVLGALLVLKIQSLLPFLLALAAGAMIYVVVNELIPESQGGKNKNLITLFTLIGFSVMMILDIALG